MRRPILSAVLLPLLLALACTAARANTLLQLQADHISFYYDRFLLEADGHVRVQTSDGFTASGDAFSMDLKLNRFVLAGHVTLSTKSGRASGAAISDFLDFNRIYFVPITSEPDRWTFLNDDLAHPVKGRIMPGDVFFLPQLSGTPSITAKTATVGTRTFVRFGDADTYLAGVGIPLRSYVVNFSSNQYFAQNSLSGANFDLTWNFAGNDNSLSALHVRYDDMNYGPFLSFEQHLVGKHEYAVFSINPLTKQDKFANLQLYEQLGREFQIQTFTQFYTRNLIDPEAAAQTTYITANKAFPHSYLTAYSILTNYNLLGPSAYDTANGEYVGALNHPSQLQLTWTSFNNRIFNWPLYEQTYVSYGFNHDSVGVQYVNSLPNPPGLQSFPACYLNKTGTAYTCPGLYYNILNQIAGYTVSMEPLKFGNLNSAYDNYYLNASINAQRQWYQVPHHVNTTTTTASLSRQFTRQIGTYLAYQVANTNDLYETGGYPAYVPSTAPALQGNCVPDGKPPYYTYCDYGYAAFRGASTLRTLNLGINYIPSPEFNFTLLMRKHDDFPKPFAGGQVFGSPLTNPIGQPLTLNYLGQPPYDITPDVRFKVLPHMLLDISRTYYFNFANERWSHNFIVQVLPQ